MSVHASPVAFAQAMGAPALWDWQAELLGRALRREDGRFVTPIVGVSLPRGDGKSYVSGLVGAWRLVAGPAPTHVLSVALDTDGAKLTVRYAREFLRPLVERGEIVERADGFEVPATGSRWEIASREHTSSRGRHPDVVLYDEMGWARDADLFESLLSSQASVLDPLLLVTSTVGARQSGPLWELAQRAAQGDPAVFWEHSTVNRSPLVTAEYLDRMRRLKHPVEYAREHGNTWSDGEDSYATAEQVDRAMGRGWEGSELPEDGRRYHCFVDLGVVHDPTVVAIGHEEPDGMIYVDKLLTYQGSKRRPVDLGLVREELRSLHGLWKLHGLRIESWQGIAVGQDLVRSGVAADVRTPTMTTQHALWSALAVELAAGTLALPPHERLREELLNLRVELRPGGGIKVTDRGKIHQDHALACGGVVEMIVAARSASGAAWTICTRCTEWHPTSGPNATACAPGGQYVRRVGDLVLVGERFRDKAPGEGWGRR